MKTRFQIIAKAKHIRAECLQILTDADYWNTHVRKECEAQIDPDPDGQLKRTIESIDVMLANEIRISEPK